jgi:hypothetical protein
MKYIKTVNEYSSEENSNLKHDLVIYYLEHEDDFDEEETENVIEILDVLKDDLSNMDKWDKVALLRLLQDDEELYDKVEAIEVPEDEETEFL